MKYMNNFTRAFAFTLLAAAPSYAEHACRPCHFTDEVLIRNEKGEPQFTKIYSGVFYTVQQGDCLKRIARTHGMTFEELLLCNPEMEKRAPEYVIHPGEELKLMMPKTYHAVGGSVLG